MYFRFCSAGKFNKVTHGYSDILKLPAGAASIKIVQRSVGSSKNDSTLDNIYLALKTRNGDYILNGNYKLYTVKKDIDVNGKLIKYFVVNYRKLMICYCAAFY